MSILENAKLRDKAAKYDSIVANKQVEGLANARTSEMLQRFAAEQNARAAMPTQQYAGNYQQPIQQQQYAARPSGLAAQAYR